MKTNIIEEYYCLIKTDFMPEFENLTKDEILRIKNTLGFAGYALQKAGEAFSTDVSNFLKKTNKMSKLKIEGKEITNTYDNQVFASYKDALCYGVDNLGWADSEIIDRVEPITLEVEGNVIDTELRAVYIDSGSDDYLYFLKW